MMDKILEVFAETRTLPCAKHGGSGKHDRAPWRKPRNPVGNRPTAQSAWPVCREGDKK